MKKVSLLTAAQLAQNKGCVLRMQAAEEAPLYWVENDYFISRPFNHLSELVQFIHLLPVFRAGN